MPGVASKHEPRSKNAKFIFKLIHFYIAAVVFRGYRKKKRSAAKYPRLYSPQNVCVCVRAREREIWDFSNYTIFQSLYSLDGTKYIVGSQSVLVLVLG